MANKGSPFERSIAKTLSKWWSEGENENVFWRSQTSGARATFRAQKGLDTKGQYGDLAATDPSGAPFLRVFCVEIKRGYSSDSHLDVIDRPKEKLQTIEKWIEKARRCKEQAKSFSWMVISRRDKRLALVTLPLSAAEALGTFCNFDVGKVRVKAILSFPRGKELEEILVMKLSDFLSSVPPEAIRSLDT